MEDIKKRTINPENWVDDVVTYSVEGNNLIIFDEKFPITESDMEDGTITYSIEGVGITAFQNGNLFYAVDECDVCSREAKEPIDAIVKVLANIL